MGVCMYVCLYDNSDCTEMKRREAGSSPDCLQALPRDRAPDLHLCVVIGTSDQEPPELLTRTKHQRQVIVRQNSCRVQNSLRLL